MTSSSHSIDAHRTALLRLVAMLVEASGLVPGKPGMLSRIIRNSVLHTLRPAEAAVRRLIVALAEDLAARGLIAAPRETKKAPTRPIPRGTGERAAPFALFDPRRLVGSPTGRRYAKGAGPRLSFFDGSDPVVEPAAAKTAVSPDEPVDASRISRRLQALQHALADLPKQAQRLRRMQARRAKAEGARVRSPLRPGRPPGHRTRRRFEVDEILTYCHLLALMALAAPDTS